MSVSISHSIPAATDIHTKDIYGLWEVIRISRGDSIEYPWVGHRFKYSFQPEMNFLCLQNGQNSHGTWELSEKFYETQKRYSTSQPIQAIREVDGIRHPHNYK